MKTAKGAEDETKQETLTKDHIKKTIEKEFLLHCFDKINTPIIELEETLTQKYAGGNEILKEIYTLQDQGKRKLALRYDLTVPLARHIAQNPTIKLPFKRFQIGSVFRDGPIKQGRKRQFTQIDADIIGEPSYKAEIELLSAASNALKKLNIKHVIKINDRQILNETLKKCNIQKTQEFILTLDKLEKIGEQGVKKELHQKGYDPTNTQKALDILSKPLEQITKEIGEAATKNLKETLTELKKNKANIEFSPTLARGLSYYTGLIYEGFSIETDFTSSILGGGRYDNMLKEYTGKDFPSAGISFGLEPLYQIMKNYEASKENIIIHIKQEKKAKEIMNILRDLEIPTEISPKSNIKKSMSYANAKNKVSAIIIGEDEVKNNTYTLRNLETGNEQKIKLKQIKENPSIILNKF